jgi:hypothetical protein
MAKKKPKTSIKKKKNAANLEINKEKLESTIQKKWIVKSIELMKEGYSPSYIRDYLRKNKEGSKSESAIGTIVSEANAFVVSSQFSKAQEIFPLHIMRYNQQLARLMKVEDGDDLIEKGEEIDSDKYWKLREKKITARSNAINTLIQKESILQYHNKDFSVEINIEEEIEIREVKPILNLEKLTLGDQIKFYELMKLCRKDENELLKITQVEEVEAVKTEDVEAEVVERVNVEDIKIEQLPVVVQTSKITSSDPTVRLRESLQKLAAKQFKEAGGKLTDDEENLIKDDGKK